ncbi:MAG: NucA/NucB deoxyribonuclease domain-containing protein [Ancalomicrobiaceae bacterium]|nr:NucA/NucB deoxyribonuclease domain-containing protein [Ancalomicrobiaceae bacterium]
MAIPILVFDYNTHQQLADNIWHAQMAGHPQVLTYNGPDVVTRRQTRRDAMHYDDGQDSGEIPRILSRDEYPFACTVEGGKASWVGHIPGRENSSQGGLIAAFLRQNNVTATQNSTFLVRVINHPRGRVRPDPKDPTAGPELARRAALAAKIAETIEAVARQVSQVSGEHALQSQLINKPSVIGFTGYWVNHLFNADVPPLYIWNEAEGEIAHARRLLREGNLAAAAGSAKRAEGSMVKATIAYRRWKDGIEAAGKAAQIAIGVVAATLILAAVAAFVAAPAAAGAGAEATTAAGSVDKLALLVSRANALAVRVAVAEGAEAAPTLRLYEAAQEEVVEFIEEVVETAAR